MKKLNLKKTVSLVLAGGILSAGALALTASQQSNYVRFRNHTNDSLGMVTFHFGSSSTASVNVTGGGTFTSANPVSGAPTGVTLLGNFYSVSSLPQAIQHPNGDPHTIYYTMYVSSQGNIYVIDDNTDS